MLNDKVLDDDLFRKSYLHRLKNIIANQIIMTNKINNSQEDWTLFKDLMKRYEL